MDRTDKRIILTLAECDMNVTQTAQKLYMHRNSIVYHINRVKKKTGLNPLCFYDLCKLILEIETEGVETHDAETRT